MSSYFSAEAPPSKDNRGQTPFSMPLWAAAAAWGLKDIYCTLLELRAAKPSRQKRAREDCNCIAPSVKPPTHCLDPTVHRL